MDQMLVIWNMRIFLSTINLAILILLIYIFAKKYMEIRSNYTLGFLIFAIVLLFRTFFASPLIKILLGIHYASGIDEYRVIADVFELFALGVFLYISTR